jgi:hypothetical protein
VGLQTREVIAATRPALGKGLLGSPFLLAGCIACVGALDAGTKCVMLHAKMAAAARWYGRLTID